MPEKTKKRKGGGIEKRVFMHYRSLKGHMIWVKDYDCDKSHDYWQPHVSIPHMHGHQEFSTPNHIWLLLARRHKMPVRQVKDIINKMRGKDES